MVGIFPAQRGRGMTTETRMKTADSQQGGFVLVAVIAIVTVMIATGVAFMRWSVDEGDQSKHTVAAMQAYYLGQTGIVEKGFAWLKTRPANDLPLGEVVLNGSEVDGLGKYENVRILPLIEAGGNFWAQERIFKITAVGVVSVPFYQDGRSDAKEVKRRAVLWVSVRSFSDYMYLSNYETTNFGDIIRFWHLDTLNGRVHSNSRIHIMENPVFYDLVTSTADDFGRGVGYNPQFRGPLPMFEQPAVLIPEVASTVRECASTSGYFFNDGGDWTYRVIFNGSSATWYKWPTGTPFDSSQNGTMSISDNCAFFESPLEMYGTLDGAFTIGSAFTIRLLDDIRYNCVPSNDRQARVPTSCDDYLGIVSEADIKVANTPKNGRENSNGLGQNQPNTDLTDIRINAAVVALGNETRNDGSFTFENQNDPDSGYVCTCAPDDRGFIYLYGSVTQRRRGYVHRSTRGSTGYGKQYRYDIRLLSRRPPGFLDAVDDAGHALFDIVQWGEDAPPQNNGTVTRFN